MPYVASRAQWMFTIFPVNYLVADCLQDHLENNNSWSYSCLLSMIFTAVDFLIYVPSRLVLIINYPTCFSVPNNGAL